MSLADLQAYATQVATEFGIPPSLFIWQIGQESSFNPNAQNGPASGIAQFMPGTAAQYGVNVNDPYSSLRGAAQYDADLYNQYGNWRDVLAHYGTAFTPDSPASVNTAATAAINAAGGNAATDYFSGVLNGLENMFGFGPGVPQANGADLTPQNRYYYQNGQPTTANNARGSLVPNLSGYLSRGVTIALALIFIAGGIYLFGSGRQIAILKKA